MGRAADSPLDARLRQVARRLAWQRTADRYAAWLPVLGAAVLVGSLALPLVWPSMTGLQFVWLVLGSVTAFLIGERVIARRRRPTITDSALELDRRFALSERATTAVSLDGDLKQTQAGRALWLDASAKVEPIRVKDRFAITYSRRLWLLPLALYAAALAWIFLRGPILENLLGLTGSDAGGEQVAATQKPAPTKPILKMPREREGKSEELQKLEAELDELFNSKEKKTPSDDSKSPGESAREQIEKVAEQQEKLRKLERAKIESLRKMTEQLGKLDPKKTSPGDDTNGLQDALTKGNFDKARDEVDKLRKKAKAMKPEEAQKLQKEMEKLTDEIEKLTRDQENKEELQKAIDKAKQEGRDAESLEREMQQLQQDAKKMEQLQKVAEKMKAASEALKEQNMEKADEQLGELAESLKELGDELQDLEDIDEHLQNLRELKKKLCKQCEGQGESESQEPRESPMGKGKGVAWGDRPEDKDAKSDSKDERIRTKFDPTGQKRFAGSVDGPAFKKQSKVQMAGEIQQAAQDAPEAGEVQTLPRGAKGMIQEYFEGLGNYGKK